MSKNKNLEIKIIRTKIEIQKTKKTKLYFFRRGERQRKKKERLTSNKHHTFANKLRTKRKRTQMCF
jgi:hypothetical protein